MRLPYRRSELIWPNRTHRSWLESSGTRSQLAYLEPISRAVYLSMYLTDSTDCTEFSQLSTLEQVRHAAVYDYSQPGSSL